MKRIAGILLLKLSCVTTLCYSPVSSAAESLSSSVKVGVYAKHVGGKIVYHYRVINHHAQTINAISIGRNSRNDEDPNNDILELFELPSGWHGKLGIPAASSSSPTGWRVSLSELEKTKTHAILWEFINNRSPLLASGQTLSKMSVAVDRPDIRYLTGHATVRFVTRPATTLTVPIEQLDTTPPNLSVNLIPSTISSTGSSLGSKHIPVNAVFTIKDDDYDRLPEVKLESITANEPLEPDDIRDASLGVDDRYIKLRANRNGATDRIYTVIYSATDASGNQTLASATVNVPQVQTEN